MPWGDDEEQPAAPQPYYVATQQNEFNEAAAKKSRELSTYDYEGPGSTRSYVPIEGGDRMKVVDTLTEPAKSIYDKSQGAQLTLADYGLTLANRARDALGQPGAYQTPGLVSRVDRLDFAGAPQMMNPEGYSADSQRLADTIYARSQKRLDPQYERADDQLRSRLVAQGIAEGSEAHRRAMEDFTRAKQDDYAAARDSADLAGRQEYAAQFARTGTARQQAISEALQDAQWQNAARDAMAKEQGYTRSEDLGLLNAILRGNQVALPTITAGPSVNVPAANYAGLVQQDYANQLAQAQRGQDQNSAAMGSLFGLLGTGVGSYLGGPAGGAAGGAAGRSLGGLF